MRKNSLTWILLLCLVACSSSFPSEDTFDVGLSVSSTSLQTNQEIIIDAMLLNRSKHTYTISHADEIFYFHIFDEQGNNVNDFYMSMIGKTTKMKGERTLPEAYKYKFDKPGSYKVWATAKFSINNGKEKKEYEYNSEKMIIEVK
jgi:hypothetical protein